MHMSRLSSMLVLSLSLCGCAALSPRADDANANASVASSTRHGAFLGASVGCATGVVSSLFTGGGLDVRRCAMGAAAGAVVGGVAGYRQGLQRANALANEARAQGLKASVTTKAVTVQSGPDRGTSTEALDSLTIALRAADVAQQAPATVRVLSKAAVLADQSAEPVTILVRGLPAQREWMAEQLRSALRPGTKTVVTEQAAATPSLQLSPVPASATTDRPEVQ